MNKHTYECLGSTSYQLIIWAFGRTFGIHVIWSNGLFLVLYAFERMSEEEYVKVRDEQI